MKMSWMRLSVLLHELEQTIQSPFFKRIKWSEYQLPNSSAGWSDCFFRVAISLSSHFESLLSRLISAMAFSFHSFRGAAYKRACSDLLKLIWPNKTRMPSKQVIGKSPIARRFFHDHGCFGWGSFGSVVDTKESSLQPYDKSIVRLSRSTTR